MLGRVIGKSINRYRLIDFFDYRFESVNIDYRDLLRMRTNASVCLVFSCHLSATLLLATFLL